MRFATAGFAKPCALSSARIASSDNSGRPWIPRILEATGIGLGTFYSKLNRIHEQCQAFAMLVHQQYTMYSHFLMLAQLMKSAPKDRLFLDQDSGIRCCD